MTIKPLLLACLLATTSAIIWAKPPENRPGHGDRARPGGKGPDATSAPLERYLNQLRQGNPEEHQRLSDLREQDPGAFRRELRRKAFGKRENSSFKPDRPHPLREEISALRNAESEADREQALQAIRTKVSERVDGSLADRVKVIEEIRRKLQRLEEQNEQELARREEIIAHHMQRILDQLEAKSEEPSDPGNESP